MGLWGTIELTTEFRTKTKMHICNFMNGFSIQKHIPPIIICYDMVLAVLLRCSDGSYSFQRWTTVLMVDMAVNRRLLTWRTLACVNAERDSHLDRMGSPVTVSIN